MPVRVVIGIKALSIEAVSGALGAATGQAPDRRDSLYLGEYDLFRLPEEVRVKYNFVAGMGDWDYPGSREYGVLIVAGETERPDYVRALAAGLGYESRALEERAW